MAFKNLRSSTALLFLGFLSQILGCSRPQTIKIDGSSTVEPITRAVEEAIRDKHSLRITVGISGTGGGMKKFSVGEIDIADASRVMKPEEVETCKKNNIDFVEFQVAFDGLAVIVNPENNWCDNLTVQQLKSIWEPNSSIKTWKDIDPKWPDEKIVLVGPGTDSGTFDYFTESIVGKAKESRSDYSASEEDNALVRSVAESKNALGYFGYAYYDANKDTLKLVGIDDGSGPIKPSKESVLDGTYTPLSRPLFIYVNKASLEREDVATFVKYYLENADVLAEKVAYVPVPENVKTENLKKFKESTKESTSK